MNLLISSIICIALTTCVNTTNSLDFTTKDYIFPSGEVFSYVQIASGLEDTQNVVNEALEQAATEWLCQTDTWVADAQYSI